MGHTMMLIFVLPYLESLHSSEMQVYKFVELNPLVALHISFLMTLDMQY
jgi:hypothetical protein